VSAGWPSWWPACAPRESARTDRLFDDRLAVALVATGHTTIPDVAALPVGITDFIAVRTRFFDEQALDACATGIRQVVLLAAGLDGRAMRLPWPAGVRVFELDLPELFALKEPVVAALAEPLRCRRVVVPVDLRGDWADALTGTGFEPDVPTGWLAEGLLMYLAGPEIERLLATVTGLSAPGSRFTADYLDGTVTDRQELRPTSTAVRQQGAELQPLLDRPAAWLAGHGWRSRLTRIPEHAERYGRVLPEGMDPVASGAIVLVAADR
jgi:methyltransferase (TIGR00027 family)